jgi:hypothetical protein
MVLVFDLRESMGVVYVYFGFVVFFFGIIFSASVNKPVFRGRSVADET